MAKKTKSMTDRVFAGFITEHFQFKPYHGSGWGLSHGGLDVALWTDAEVAELSPLFAAAVRKMNRDAKTAQPSMFADEAQS